MREEYCSVIAENLQAIPNGTFEIKRYNALNTNTEFYLDKITTHTKGKGKIEVFLVFPGIEVSFHSYLADRVSFHHEAVSSILEISHCKTGRIGWNMRGNVAIYLGSGDLCLHTMECCADSEMILPLGYYEGVAITFNLKILEQKLPEILKECNFDIDKVYKKIFTDKKPLGIPSSPEVDRIFTAFYDQPKQFRTAYCKLKAQEVLLYLAQLNVQEEKELTQYISQHTELIKEIRNYLIEHLDERITIEELSKKYLINTSTLKSVFKAVYGLPIASYVKEYRIKKAMKLLRETNDSIAAIAESIGYETQGKFTKAFKNSVQILPTEYRKMHKNNI